MFEFHGFGCGVRDFGFHCLVFGFHSSGCGVRNFGVECRTGCEECGLPLEGTSGFRVRVGVIIYASSG